MADPLQTLLDKQAIAEQIARYSRGVDRMDKPLARACWHADGTADYRGIFEGTADALLDWMWVVHANMQTHSHQMTSSLIEVSGDQASSETYATVVLRTAEDPQLDVDTRGRYVDTWSRRQGVWAIDHRVHLADHVRSMRVSTGGRFEPAGRRDARDDSYGVLKCD
jgi:hypothetical protein